MRAFLAGQTCLIRNPSAIRPWQFVLEPLRGYLMLAERLAEDASRFASAWNFGPAEADAKPVSWIADELARSWGNRRFVAYDDAPDAPAEAHFSSWTPPRRRPSLAGIRCLPLTRRSTGSSSGTAPSGRSDLQRLTRTQIEQYEALLNQQN